MYIKESGSVQRRAFIDFIEVASAVFVFIVTNRSGTLRVGSLAKRLNRYIQAPSKEMQNILHRVEYDSKGLKELYMEIVCSCCVCVQSGLPSPCKKLSFLQV